MKKKYKLLIVEDSSLLAEMYVYLFDNSDFETIVKYTGFEARIWLENNTPDLVLLDLNLPYVSGENILRQIRQDPRFHATRIFIISGHGQQSHQLEDKVDAVLNKPVQMDELKKLSKRYFQLNDPTDSNRPPLR